MNHEEFQFAVDADPTHLSAEQRAHLAGCAECAAFYEATLALEARLRPALEIAVPDSPRPAISLTTARATRASMWPYGIAAAVALVSVLVTALVVSVPRDALARSVAMHMAKEPLAFTQTATVPDEKLRRVLDAAHVAILPGGPTVTYASSCPLRGHVVPHLAVLTDHGPVVVMILPEEKIAARQRFDENGYHGVLVPAVRGSIAIVSPQERDFDQIVSLVSARIRYLD